MLDSDAVWVTPQNIREFGSAAPEAEEQVFQSMIRNGKDHPPLSSPEAETPSNTLQFHTQAPPMMDEAQFKGTRADLGSGGVASSQEHEASEERVYEWDETPPPEPVDPQNLRPQTHIEETKSLELDDFGSQENRPVSHLMSKLIL